MQDDLLELVAPGGCDEANHGVERYRVDNNGRVRVPREAAYWLIRNGGFKPVPAPAPVQAQAPQRDEPAPAKAGGAAKASPREGRDPRRIPRRSTT
jgi:hypothetical protein